MCSATIRTASVGSSNSAASVRATTVVPWLASYTVSRPSTHTAVAACGSSGLLCCAGVEYTSSTRTGDAPYAPSKSPESTSVS